MEPINCYIRSKSFLEPIIRLPEIEFVCENEIYLWRKLFLQGKVHKRKQHRKPFLAKRGIPFFAERKWSLEASFQGLGLLPVLFVVVLAGNEASERIVDCAGFEITFFPVIWHFELCCPGSCSYVKAKLGHITPLQNFIGKINKNSTN